jgi:hypothetical protein
MEALKLSIDVDEKRQVVVNLPQSIPVGKAEVTVIIHPLKNGREKRGNIDLASRGITPAMAAEMRNRLISFEEDWNAPGMEAYDEL